MTNGTTTMAIALPAVLRDWVDAQANSGAFQDASDYLRELIRRDLDRARAVANIQAEVDEGLASGISHRSMAEILEIAREQAAGTPEA